MITSPMGRLERALRERLEMAGCYFLRDGDGGDGTEIWFTPHLNREFELLPPVTSPQAANAVLRAAGMEQAFRSSRSGA